LVTADLTTVETLIADFAMGGVIVTWLAKVIKEQISRQSRGKNNWNC